MLGADRAALDGDNKRLAASDRCHNSFPPPTPPSHSPLPLPLPAAKQHMDGRVLPEKGNRGALRRQAGRRPPGGDGHPGAARKLDTNRPDEHRRRPDERGVCRGANLIERHAFAKQQVADIEEVVVSSRES